MHYVLHFFQFIAYCKYFSVHKSFTIFTVVHLYRSSRLENYSLQLLSRDFHQKNVLFDNFRLKKVYLKFKKKHTPLGFKKLVHLPFKCIIY